MKPSRPPASALALAALLGGALFASGCMIDTELGLASRIDSAALRSSLSGAEAELTMSVMVTFRVGEHAEGARDFYPNSIEAFVGDQRIGEIVPDAPPGFDPHIEPGQERQTTLSGTTTIPMGTHATLCGASSVTLLLRFTDGATGMVDQIDGETADVVCE